MCLISRLSTWFLGLLCISASTGRAAFDTSSTIQPGLSNDITKICKYTTLAFFCSGSYLCAPVCQLISHMLIDHRQNFLGVILRSWCSSSVHLLRQGQTETGLPVDYGPLQGWALISAYAELHAYALMQAPSAPSKEVRRSVSPSREYQAGRLPDSPDALVSCSSGQPGLEPLYQLLACLLQSPKPCCLSIPSVHGKKTMIMIRMMQKSWTCVPGMAVVPPFLWL